MSATTLVLVPGLMCDQQVWAAQIDDLSGAVPALAVADHGDANSLPQMARAILSRHAGTLLAVGHSMGGRVVLEMLRQQPQRLAGVALLNTGYLPLAAGDAGERERAGRLTLVELARREGLRAMARVWVQNMVHPGRLTDAALIGAVEDMFARRTFGQFEAQTQALLARPDASSVLAALACPTLLLSGEQDSWSPPAQHRLMQQLAPASQVSIVSDCGHMSPMERPAAVNEALRGWLRACGG